MLNLIVEAILSIATFSIAVVCLFGNFRVGLSILLILVSGLGLSYYGSQAYHPVAMIVCALICLTSVDGLKVESVRSTGNEATHAIVYWYCIRVLIELSMLGDGFYIEFLWVCTTLMLILQLFFAAGSCTGHADRINSFIRGGFRLAYNRVS